jgi:chromosome segregation ATPase
VGSINLRETLGVGAMRRRPDIPAVPTLEPAGPLPKDPAQLRETLAEHVQEVGFMRIQLRVRNARIEALEKQLSDLGGPRVTVEPSEALRQALTEARAALAEAEERSEQRRVALESHVQDVGFMRIELRVRNARIAALEKEVRGLGGSIARNDKHEREGGPDPAALNETIAALGTSLAERDARIATLEAMQRADGEALSLQQTNLARASAELEAQRDEREKLEHALASGSARLAEMDAAAAAAVELRDSLEATIDKQERQVSELQAELAGAIRIRDTRIAALEKEIGDLTAALAQRDERERAVQSDAAAFHESIAALTATVAERDASIAALKSTQLAHAETLAARHNDFARVSGEAEVQRQKLSKVEADLAAAKTRIAEVSAALLAAQEQRNAMQGAIAEQRRKVSGLEDDLKSTVRERDASIAALKSTQLTEGGTLAARQGDLARVIAEAEIQRKNLGRLETDLAAAKTRLAEANAAALAAQEQRNAMQTAIAEQRRRANGLQDELTVLKREREVNVEAAALLQIENLDYAARLTTASSRVLELEAEALEQKNVISAMQEELHASLERAPAQENELRPVKDWGSHAASARLDELAPADEDSIGAGAKRSVAPEGAAPLLIRTDGSEIVHVLGRRTTIGRTPENDVQIDARYISRHHAVILAGPTHTIIEDLNSTNGVVVNGRRVMRQALRDGDLVLIGREPFRFALRKKEDCTASS